MINWANNHQIEKVWLCEKSLTDAFHFCSMDSNPAPPLETFYSDQLYVGSAYMYARKLEWLT